MNHPMPVPNPLMLVSVSGKWSNCPAGDIVRDILTRVIGAVPNMTIGRIDGGKFVEAELTITDMRAGQAINLLTDQYGGDIWLNARYKANDPHSSLTFLASYLAPEVSGGFIPQKDVDKAFLAAGLIKPRGKSNAKTNK